jgi:hypothetical protein
MRNRDRDFVTSLNRDLRSAGIDTWTDLDQIEAGKEWSSQIETAIDNAAIVLYVATRHSYRSALTRAACLRALRKGIRVIPLIADESKEKAGTTISDANQDYRLDGRL